MCIKQWIELLTMNWADNTDDSHSFSFQVSCIYNTNYYKMKSLKTETEVIILQYYHIFSARGNNNSISNN